jgi:hypothetical protein
MIGQSQTLSSSEIVLITLFSAGAHRYCAFHQPWQNCAMMLSQNKFSSAKPACFDFSSSNLVLQNHILSTAEDALSQQPKHHVLHSCALNTPYEVCSSEYGALCRTLMVLTQGGGAVHSCPPAKDCFHNACPGNKEQSYMFS